jgi:peptidoglycan/LPS O-acetylase OafA/YrhL
MGGLELATVRAHERRSAWMGSVAVVITFGIILLIVGFLIHSPILWAIGIILAVVGAILAVLGAAGRAVFGRRHYW